MRAVTAPRARARLAVERLRQWARALKRDVFALWFAYRDPRTPLTARLLAMAIVAYALSPIDLIPDFIPVLGYLDELILLPAAIYLALKLIPAQVLEASRAQAATWLANNASKPKSWVAAGAIVLVWCTLAWLAWRALV